MPRRNRDCDFRVVANLIWIECKNMSINIIRVGDDTDHGGKVETGSSTMKFDGRYVARKGDRVSCPQHPDVSPNVIEEGDDSMKDNGISIARHGHRATCGCHLISSLV